MLRELRITNLALISQLHMVFDSDLVVLTGETGAGKSIILQSISLLYGAKGAKKWVRDGADSAVVEILFECSKDSPAVKIIEAHGFEAAGEIILKRRISADGKSRYYVNGGLATARVVSELAENLVSVASQHEHQQLFSQANHLNFLDAVGGLERERSAFAVQYDRWLELKKEYEQACRLETEKEQRRDFLIFQCREIEEAEIAPGEDEELARAKDRLKAADDLLKLGGMSLNLLRGRVIDALSEVRGHLAKMAGFDQGLSGLSEEVAGLSFQLEDAAGQLKGYTDDIQVEPIQLDQITARIDLLQKLKRKYGPTLSEVQERGKRFRQELDQLEDLDRQLDGLREKLLKTEGEMLAGAGELSERRVTAAKQLAGAVTTELQGLCLENARFNIHFNGREDGQLLSRVRRTGIDRPEFRFSANAGEELKPLAGVVSGGELSRLMLALKCILARHDRVETVVFDEVDAGISGKAASAVAVKIRELAGHHQVICITHLPQIAAGAVEHFRVEKNVANGRTLTSLVRLRQEDRVEELARMLDGDAVTAQTRDYVGELISRSQA